jgi:hypothetical protein
VPVSPDPRLFRLTPVGTAFSLLLTCVLIVPGAGILLSRPIETVGVAFGVYFLMTGVYLAWRILIWRVRVDDHKIHVVGILWSRRIPRSRVVGVAPNISQPAVIWRSKGGRLRTTPLNVVVMSDTPLVPRRARRRRVVFMSLLEMWVEGRSLEEAETVLEARARSRAAPPERGSRREWRVRHRVVPRRSDRLVEVVEWLSPLLSAAVVFVAIGVGRRGPTIPLPVSAVLTAVAAGLLAAVTLLLMVRRSLRNTPRTFVRWMPIFPAATTLAGAGILVFRAEQSVRWYTEVSWGIALCVAATAVVVGCAVVLRPRR